MTQDWEGDRWGLEKIGVPVDRYTDLAVFVIAAAVCQPSDPDAPNVQAVVPGDDGLVVALDIPPVDPVPDTRGGWMASTMGGPSGAALRTWQALETTAAAWNAIGVEPHMTFPTGVLGPIRRVLDDPLLGIALLDPVGTAEHWLDERPRDLAFGTCRIARSPRVHLGYTDVSIAISDAFAVGITVTPPRATLCNRFAAEPPADLGRRLCAACASGLHFHLSRRPRVTVDGVSVSGHLALFGAYGAGVLLMEHLRDSPPEGRPDLSDVGPPCP